ncbi:MULTISPECIES: hypothetical protein [unclassified Streptomyces]|uniref:hypothetical protein n=1 Tax=unclassified Streptomyces TaxID=2593676 RepID=UPI0016614359|nr:MULTISPECIES: hypothetical protein [unclassified Streptomyces]MBD0710664.1 hypothetical protein [Streptomyces sp. CBMA291]MBD0715511.1 hypothetical protein [Streptomyces sp. CBMA370]
MTPSPLRGASPATRILVAGYGALTSGILPHLAALPDAAVTLASRHLAVSPHPSVTLVRPDDADRTRPDVIVGCFADDVHSRAFREGPPVAAVLTDHRPACVELSTVSPTWAEEWHHLLREHDAVPVESPVTGSCPGTGMKATDLPALLAHLRVAFAATDDMSVALSGSLARGDFRTDEDGTIVSDLIPVVARATDVPGARRRIAPVLRDVAERFAIDATAAITLLSAYRNAPGAGYVTGMAGRPFLVDPLRLGLAPRPAAPRPAAHLPWLVQPVAYYLAKATHETPYVNLAKARTAALRLVRHLGIDDPDALCDLPRTVREVCDRREIPVLPSVAAYLNAPTDPGRFQTVRDLVFMENQGIPFSDSALTAPGGRLPKEAVNE